MALAGLGSPHDIWHWPLHYYRNVRREYLRIISPPETAEEADDGSEEIDVDSE